MFYYTHILKQLILSKPESLMTLNAKRRVHDKYYGLLWCDFNFIHDTMLNEKVCKSLTYMSYEISE